MVEVEDLKFVNRGEELAMLHAYLHRQDAKMPVAVILRSPSGFGKSRLTDQFCRSAGVPGLAICVVDPEIQGTLGAARLHDGFFVQRCAEQLSLMAETGAAPWPALSDFLKSRKAQTVKEKKPGDFLAEMPGTKSAYKIVLDYAARYFSFGDFAPKKLLTSDRNEAVRICEEYAEFVLHAYPVLLVLREMQHGDHRSWRTLVRWAEALPRLDLIIEYTSLTGAFEPAHQKLLYPLTSMGRYFLALDLLRLDEGHLEHLIRTNVRSDFSLDANAYCSWDGNLRSIIEMQFQVLIGHNISSPRQIGAILSDLPKTLEGHIAALSTGHRLVLAVCSAHVESIEMATLAAAMAALSPLTSPLVLNKALKDLVETHQFLIVGGGAYRIHNETVADALRDLPAMRALVASAEKALRDYYAGQVYRSARDSVGMSAVVRQLFRLCARTKDVAGLLRATESLAEEVEHAQDPTLYVEVIVDAVAADPGLYAGSRDALLRWAGSLAYDVGNFGQASLLLSQLAESDAMCLAMRACALAETGGHDQALHIAATLRQRATLDQTRLAADLIEALVRGCRGERQRARALLTAAIGDPRYADSPLLGYAYRFFEPIEDYTVCIDQLRHSIAWFDRFGLKRSKACSQLAVAVLVARMGQLSEARAMIAEAAQILDRKAPGRHLLLNNMAAIELLADQPRPERCKHLLGEALRYVRDDYSEATILSNLSLAHWLAGELAQAQECGEKLLQILAQPDFADRECYWPLCFNAAHVAREAGALANAQQWLDMPVERAGAPQMNGDYWAFRYGQSSQAGAAYAFLANKPYHPVYLSAWLIDSDGLSQLKQEQLQ